MKLSNLTNYEILEEKEIKDIKSEGAVLRHKETGARVVVISNDDKNKVFTIGFRTPTTDSTGVPHILEHSVLCGSKAFPTKDPFVELAKGSLNTFLNAMTYPDKTVYPVASCNDKDFQNLMHVYLDAVFYPNIYEHEEIFKQEGWSYKLDDKDADLEYNGVVYNEMKGAFSSPDGVLDRVILNSLFPDTTYNNESGGDPDVIPELTYEQFLDFHRSYYHPSNSYIYLYGDMDMEEKLNWIDEHYLSDFKELAIDSEVKLQKPFEQMVEKEIEYSISNAETEEDNTYLSWNKVIGTILDKELYQAFQVLDYALLSAPGAPLKKALTDAGIGKDILGSYDNGTLQPMFSIVAKNANMDDKEEFLQVIEDTLKQLVAQGINKKSLLAGINFHEFQFREGDFGRYPRGLMYGLEMFDSWLYDESKPFMHIESLEVFDSMKEKVETQYFEELIQTYLLDNTHGSIVIVKPEKGRSGKLDQELKDKLQAYKASLTAEEIVELVNNTQALLAYQDEPSSEEDLKKIPQLLREDIGKDIAPIVNEELDLEGTCVLYHEIDTNGIGYLDFIFDLKQVSTELLPYIGLLQAVTGMMDTKEYEYGELFNEINVNTGGISTGMEIYPDVTKVKEKVYKTTFEIKTKALYSKLPIAKQLMLEMLCGTKFDDEKRLKEILDMIKSRLQARFQSAGHTTAVGRAMSYHSVISKYKDITSGISFYEFACDLIDNYEDKKAEIISNLEQVSKIIFREENLMVSFTAEPCALEETCSLVKELKGALYKEAINTQPYTISVAQKNEGLKTSSKVQYVARTGNFIDQGLEYTGTLQILKVIMSYEYLWQNVRVKGGAYGCMSGFNRIGEGFFTSYRDPRLKETMEIYENVVEYIEKFEADEYEMTKFIIGTMSNIDQPMTPAAEGDRSLNLYMNHVSEAMLKKERKDILEATDQDIKALAKVVRAVLNEESLCVIGGEEKIEENKSMFKEVRDLFQ